jgi:hypothetical protein
MICKNFLTLLFVAGMVMSGVNPACGQKIKLNHLTTFDEKVLHFGFTLGINTFDFSVRNYVPIGARPGGFKPEIWQNDVHQIGANDTVRADVASPIPGFTVGIIMNLRLTKSLDLRFLPGMSFGERELTYNIPVIDNLYDYNDIQYKYSIKSTFIDLPFHIKYKANRINNGRPYIIMGTAMRVDISKTATEDLVGLDPIGYYAEVGAGWDYYFQFFRFSVEAKASFGLNNQLGKGPGTADQRHYYYDALRSLHSNIFTLCFHFE